MGLPTAASAFFLFHISNNRWHNQHEEEKQSTDPIEGKVPENAVQRTAANQRCRLTIRGNPYNIRQAELIAISRAVHLPIVRGNARKKRFGEHVPIFNGFLRSQHIVLEDIRRVRRARQIHHVIPKDIDNVY